MTPGIPPHAAATIVFVPLTYWSSSSPSCASTAYVQNWHLAQTAADYFASDDGPSPVRHFWSLSAEEQFYLGWPLLWARSPRVGARSSSRSPD